VHRFDGTLRKGAVRGYERQRRHQHYRREQYRAAKGVPRMLDNSHHSIPWHSPALTHTPRVGGESPFL
jgi:hypothetical protein